jgi:hypothetical protein
MGMSTVRTVLLPGPFSAKFLSAFYKDVLDSLYEVQQSYPRFSERRYAHMTKIRKLMVFCAMALMMMVVALPSALAQDYYYAWEPYYYDPSWDDTPASTDTSPTSFIIVGNDLDDGGQVLVARDATIRSFSADGIEIG